MTLFYMTVNSEARRVRWVRAGHDPALLYDPATDNFEELKGPGIALGVDEDWTFQASVRENLVAGQIILLFTDGIWEAHNDAGQNFGKEPIYKIVRSNKDRPAKEILNALFHGLTRFQGSESFEDDVTLVLIKVMPAPARRTA